MNNLGIFSSEVRPVTKRSVRRRSNPSWKQDIVLSLAAMLSTATLMLALVPSSLASLEVLSDMDCVIEPSATVDVGSAVSGLIAHSYFDKSDFVNKGDIMAELESEVERVTLAIAEQVARSSTAVELRKATAAFGERTRDRNEKLLKTSGVSRQLVDQMNTEAHIASLQVNQERENKRLAELEVERAKASLARRQIRSPISGTVVKLVRREGEYVDSDPVYQVAQLNPLNVEVIVPVEYLRNLSTGMNAAIRIDVPGFENKVLSGQVRRIDAVADTASATYGIRLTLENPDFTIPSGVRCQIDFLAS